MFKVAKKFFRLMKDQFWRAKQEYLKYYRELPIDDKIILLESEHGKKLDGSIFYIIKYLATGDKYQDYKIYVTSLGRNLRRFKQFMTEHGIENVTPVMLASDEYMRLLASAKYLINDTSFGPYYIKKEGQVYLNTWHGTPLKTLGKSDATDYHSIGNILRNFVESDYLMYPNAYTRDIMIRDYMLENISQGSVIMSGYPRNEVFFDSDARQAVRERLELNGKRVYVYMPTYRGKVSKGKTSKSSAYLTYYLFELDKRLGEDEILYVNLHPLATDGIDFSEFKNIRKFPKEYEVYEFLNIADVLITDYSSVFFDFAVTGRKIVLFTYDEEEYLATRGMYFDIRGLPFPRVYELDSLMEELRSEKNYDEKSFLSEFCPYDCANASQLLCDRVILCEDTGLEVEPIKDNGKENVLIYAGNLAGNGITVSLISLLNTIDIGKRNYIVAFKTEHIAKNKEQLKKLPEGVTYFPFSGDFNLTIWDRVKRKFFKSKLITATSFAGKSNDLLGDAFMQFFGGARINSVIQFNGYEAEIILLFSAFPGKKTIFVHNNMVEEARKKKNQRWDVLEYAYRHYDNVAIVTEDMRAPTLEISKHPDNIKVVKNTINYSEILEKAKAEFEEGSYAKCSVTFDEARAALESDAIKFINIGRYSPEKGQDRLIDAFAAFNRENPNSYLFIIGGYTQSDTYDNLLKQLEDYSLSDRVILLTSMPNPYTVLKKCDYFILSSRYEGFGLVLAEADILGKPVISTDIAGPRTFMQRYGGTLVEDSTEGILSGMHMLTEGKVPVMNVDYEQYNDETRKQFEALF